MREHNETITSEYSKEQLYALVRDVESYPDFIPWCTGARIREKNNEWIIADLIVGFKGFSEQYTSKVHLLDNDIEIEYLKGPFSHLENKWHFEELANGGTEISFMIKFEFKSKILQTLIGGLFDVAVMKMMHAFETRADEVYGK